MDKALLLRCSQLVLHVLGCQNTTNQPQHDAAATGHSIGAAGAAMAVQSQQVSADAERLRFLGFAIMKLAVAQHTWEAAQQLRLAWGAPSGRHVAWRHLTDQASHMMTVRHR